MQPGATQQFAATVNGTSSPAQTVTWTVTGAVKAETAIDTSGLLTVAADETAQSLTVTATSTADPGKSGTAMVTVSNTPAPAVHTITVSAGEGGSISPSGSVSVTNGANQTFVISANSGYSIASVTVDGTNQGAVSTYTFSNVTAAHTISAAFSKNSSGGGSSGGSSGDSSGGTATPPASSTQEKPATGQTTVTAPVDQNGNANVMVSDKVVADAIKAAKDAAKNGEPIHAQIKAESDKAATQITTTLPMTVQDALVGNQVDSVQISTDMVTMTFSQAVIRQMNEQAKADVTLTVAKSDTSNLTGDAKTLIGSRPMYDFNATFGEGNKITDFGGSTVSIAIPYTPDKSEASSDLLAIYVDSNGVASKITGSGYDAERQAVIFTTGHFSLYGVGYQAVTTYTVQKGDSFWGIARKQGCSMSELEQLNNKSRFDIIYPGDVLRVPEK